MSFYINYQKRKKLKMERVIELRKSELRKNWKIGFGHYYGKDSPSVRAHLGFKNWLNCFGAERIPEKLVKRSGFVAIFFFIIWIFLPFFISFFNPCGENDQLIVHFNFAKNS